MNRPLRLWLMPGCPATPPPPDDEGPMSRWRYQPHPAQKHQYPSSPPPRAGRPERQRLANLAAGDALRRAQRTDFFVDDPFRAPLIERALEVVGDADG